MPAQAQAKSDTGFIIDRDSHTIRLSRVFDAPPSEIFDAWTQPDQVSCWWDAAGERLSVCEIDLRPGGAFKFVTKGHPDMPFTGIYREIAPPDRLVFDAIGSIGRVLLRDVSGQTQMQVEIACTSAEQLEQFLKMGVAVGTSQTLDGLVDYIAKRIRTR